MRRLGRQGTLAFVCACAIAIAAAAPASAQLPDLPQLPGLPKSAEAGPVRLLKDKTCEDYEMPSSQWCYDAVRQRPVGPINQPLIHWINRPTFQQLVEVGKWVPR